MDWFERNFGKMFGVAFVAFVVIDLAILAVAIWGVIKLVTWVVAQ